MAEQKTYTPAGFKALQDELDYLVNVRVEENKKEISTSRAFGDLSENSEYDEAKQEQGKIHARIDELRQQHKACYTALKAIENASDNLREEISPRLGEYTTSLMEVMTDRKYSNIDVSDGLKVAFASENGEKKSVDFLSGGTRDLTYVSLRMALIDMLYTEKPPVLFDESFAHQDNQRAKSMMRAIKKLSKEGQQSFVFTCREREATLAKEMSAKAEIYKFSVGDDDIA